MTADTPLPDFKALVFREWQKMYALRTWTRDEATVELGKRMYRLGQQSAQPPAVTDEPDWQKIAAYVLEGFEPRHPVLCRNTIAAELQAFYRLGQQSAQPPAVPDEALVQALHDVEQLEEAHEVLTTQQAQFVCDRSVMEAAADLVALWKAKKISGIPRSERNAAIEDSRERLIIAVDRSASRRSAASTDKPKEKA